MKRDQIKDKTFKMYRGAITDQMPKLIAEGRVPMNVSQLMQKRFGARNFSDDAKSSWMDNYFDTGDAVVYHPDGHVKIALDSQNLREITSESGGNGRALVLTPEQYDVISGEEFKIKESKLILDKSLNKKQVKAHPIWRVLARDPVLLGDHVDYIFAEGKQRFGYDSAMGVYLGSRQVSTPEMRVWCVNGLGSWSDVWGKYDLDLGCGRLVGVAPEAQTTKVVSGLNDDQITRILFPRTYTLRSQLETAVIDEDYESAAVLRDQINSTDEPLK